MKLTDEQNKKIEWLKRAKKADDSAKYWLTRLKHDKELACGSAKGLNDSGTYGNRAGNNTENVLINLADTERKVQEKFTELAHIHDEVASAIEKIKDEDLQAVLTWHYLKFQTWEQTSRKMHCDVSTVKRKHKKALEKLTLNELA